VIHPARKIVVILGLAALVPSLLALDPSRPVREYRLAEFGMADGLPYPSIAALAQSADGYLWVATRNGLARFDGARFTTFRHDNMPELVDDRITALLEASDGTLWIGTGQGVTLYRNGKWSRPSLGRSLDEGGIISLAETPDHSILIAQSVDRATARSVPSGVFLYRDGKVTELRLPGEKEMPRVDAMVCASATEILFAGVGLLRLEHGAITDISKEVNVRTARFFAALVDSTGKVWLGGPLGLLRQSGGSYESLATADGLPSTSIRSLVSDRDGNVWVGTSNGLARFAAGRFQPLLMHGVESLSNVICMLEDSEGNLWVGTDNGLFRVQDVKVATLSQRDGLPVNPTLCVLETRDHTRWVGTIGGGLAHITSHGIQTMRVQDGLREDSIGALAETPDGALWIAYYTKGIGRYLNGKFEYFAPGAGVRFRGLAVGAEGDVWVASSDGLFKFDGTQFERVPTDPAIQFPRALHIDPKGGVWLGGGKAFGRLFQGKWTVYHKPAEQELLPYEYIFTDSTGTTWMLQDGPNVIRIRDGELKQFPFPELGPLVYTGFEYGGELWINFRAGVARIPLSEFDAVAAGCKPSPGYTLYNDADGMRSRAPNNAGSPGCAAMTDGTLWFSTSMGVAQINPAHIRINTIVPNVLIEQVLVDKTDYRGDALQHIPPGRGELAFRYTALSFSNPAQVRFKYRLEGFDPDWIDGGTTREAHYGGLSPGRYTFAVMACNNEGFWNRTPARRTIVLEPHYYQQWWFFTAVGLMISATGGGIYRWRSRRLERRARELQRQNELLEQRIAERTAELRQSYDALRASEYFYHSLVESLPQVILRKDATGRYTYANGPAMELLDRPLADLIGRTDDDIFPPDIARKIREDDRLVIEQRQPMEREEIIEKDGAPKRYLHMKRVPLVDQGGQPLGVQVLFWDMTVFRETQDKLKHAQKELVEISRLAGIAEMATGVLHNLGNALNSVKVAAAVARTQVNNSQVARVRRVADLLLADGGELLVRSPRLAKLPQYVTLLSEQLESERDQVLRELQQLGAGIEHVAQIIAAQQAGARVSGVIEHVPPLELVDYACRMNQALLDRHDVTVVREVMPVPEISVDRQRVLQILGNLVRNAIEAVVESGRADKRITIGIRESGTGLLQVSVSDNGVGIAPQHLVRIFEFGFTTKREGHGFGLHNSALAAQELGGQLRVESDGPGKGATFILELPPAAPPAKPA
jgi:PAS domain S-box-containing protein